MNKYFIYINMLKIFEDFNNIGEVKEDILLEAISIGDKNIIEMFLNKGYKITRDSIIATSFDMEIFKYILNKINLEDYMDLSNFDWKRMLKAVNIQKVLIDMGYDHLIYSTVGFNDELANDPKYKEVIDRIGDISKYNI